MSLVQRLHCRGSEPIMTLNTNYETDGLDPISSTAMFHNWIFFIIMIGMSLWVNIFFFKKGTTHQAEKKNVRLLTCIKPPL